MKNILLLYGGGSTEHDISIKSADYIQSIVDTSQFNILRVCINKDFSWYHDELGKCQLSFDKYLSFSNKQTNSIIIDGAIPCIHGFPGETGDIQAFFELINLPYIGANSEASKLCFNKISTKLWLEKFDIPTTPFIFLKSPQEIPRAEDFFKKHHSVFIKASNQGSSVGCYPCEDISCLKDLISKAFQYSQYVLIEKKITGRELEMAVYEFNNKIHVSKPGEIKISEGFYDYNQKYSAQSQAQIITETQIEDELLQKMQDYALKSFELLKLRDLSRLDFFLDSNDQVYINEINTFPGHTHISLFPKMVEQSGTTYKEVFNSFLLSLFK